MQGTDTRNETALEKEIRGAITTFQGHRTSDGQLFEDADAAFAHQQHLHRRKRLNEFVGEFGHREMSQDEVVDMLEKHSALLVDILRPVTL